MRTIETLRTRRTKIIKKLKNQWQSYRHYRGINFLIHIILGLIANFIIGLYLVLNVLSQSTYLTSWIGNTFSGGDRWVQNSVEAMYVAPDGTVYTNSVWDEGGREAGIYKDGNVIGSLSQLHGWGRLGGEAITANSNYIYAAMQQGQEGKPGEDYPPEGTTWYCVRRYDLSGSPAPFSGGRGWDRSMLIVSTSSPVTGLAAAGKELYVSDDAANRIRIYDTETMMELGSWSFMRPGQIVVDHQGSLWIIQRKDASSAAKILHYTKTGTLLPQEITGVVEPTALAVDNRGRLLVAENGPRQQVLIYNIKKTPVMVGTFGTKGGIYSGNRGEVGDLKFYGLTGVGTDAEGNIYVNSNGFTFGTDLRKFSPSSAMQWRLLGLEFVDNADADPATDGVDVFTKQEHFIMDYSKSNGQEWTYKGFTVDKFRYPDDPRLHTAPTSAFVRNIQGKRFLYLTDIWANYLSVFRFDGEIAVPSAFFANSHIDWPTNQPANGRWLWRDINGDGSLQKNEYTKLGKEDNGHIWGWEVDSKGDVWQASESGVIRHYPFQGLDAHGSPIYSGAATETIPMPAPFSKLERIKYFPDTDTMYLGGYTTDRPQTGNEFGIVGTEIARYDNWNTTRNLSYRLILPYDSSASIPLLIRAMDVVGDKIFAVTSTANPHTAGKADVNVYDSLNGNLITKLSPGSEVASETGWVDIPYGVRAFRRANGEYVVFVEEDAKAKVIMYRLTD